MKIIQIAVGTRGSGADGESELETELYALDDDGYVHLWIDCTPSRRKQGAKAGWSKVGDLSVRYRSEGSK